MGDTWTDPQIHSFNSEGYGKGNLGQVHLVVGGEKKERMTVKCAVRSQLGYENGYGTNNDDKGMRTSLV